MRKCSEQRTFSNTTPHSPKIEEQEEIHEKKSFSERKSNSNIKSQTTRKLPLSYGDLPIREMHRGAEQRTSYIPFLLNQETRSDVIRFVSILVTLFLKQGSR
ncbi:hypothetical protein IEQ34_025755 [Dendrobium chrysotoxum]|uniref:Uncharacterized protein n=1 Tax=Dendrobium chrysotoxum TaxID=161865 RepID=A0AAV7FNE7_DENCH|nr:hypothetical protein IEQ34_025755 [Dendrobium chrysotoxum]